MTAQGHDCRDPAMLLGLWQKPQRSDVLQDLFAGRRVSYAFKTRVAIRKACDILGLMPEDEVLAPGYNCGSELDPLRAAGVTIRLYPVTATAEPDLDALARMIGPKTRAIYLTHYFGFVQPQAAAIRALCDAKGLRLIEDCALALLSGPRPADGRLGDVSVFCFYKFFPVLAGGALVINAPDLADAGGFLRPAPFRPVMKALLRTAVGRVLGPEGLQNLKRRAGRAAPDAAAGSDPQPDMPGHYYFAPDLVDRRISAFTTRALQSVDLGAAITTRQRNYLRMLDRLDRDAGLEPLFPVLPADTAPLSMPVRVRHGRRNALVHSLKSVGIPATAWWSGYNRFLDFSAVPEACALKDSVLSLPMHQYLDTSAIDHITQQMNTFARQKV